MESTATISGGRRYWFWFLAWSAALLAAWWPYFFSKDISSIVIAFSLPLFPFGLVYWIDPRYCDHTCSAQIFFLCGGWLLYALLSAILLFAAKKRFGYFCLYVLLCWLLVFNVVGCSKVVHDSSIEVINMQGFPD